MKTKERVALMGQIVTVHTELLRGKAYPKVYHELCLRNKTRAGWVVGFRHLPTGSSSWESEEVGRIFETHSLKDHPSHTAVLVTYWPSLKPVRVPLDGFTMANSHDKPYPPNGSPEEIADYKDFYRRKIQHYPRDEKGRFVI